MEQTVVKKTQLEVRHLATLDYFAHLSCATWRLEGSSPAAPAAVPG